MNPCCILVFMAHDCILNKHENEYSKIVDFLWRAVQFGTIDVRGFENKWWAWIQKSMKWEYHLVPKYSKMKLHWCERRDIETIYVKYVWAMPMHGGAYEWYHNDSCILMIFIFIDIFSFARHRPYWYYAILFGW